MEPPSAHRRDQAEINFDKRTELIQELEEDMITTALTILNLVVSSTDTATEFFSTRIRSQVYYDFGYLIPEDTKKEEIPLGLLCGSCFKHFGVKMKDKMYIQKPGEATFTREDFLGFEISSKSFSLKTHKITEVANSFSRLLKDNSHELALRCLTLKREIAELLDQPYEIKLAKLDYADQLFEQNQLDECMNQCKELIETYGYHTPDSFKAFLIILKIAIKKQKVDLIEEYYKFASSLVYYNFGEYHPLHCTLRSLMA